MSNLQANLKPIVRETLVRYHSLIIEGLREYTRNNGFTKVLVGCSGGLDSALTIALAAEALGPQNVTAITMPSEYSSEGSVSDSKVLCDNLGIPLLKLPIGFSVDTVKHALNDHLNQPVTGVALENLQARMRGLMLMTYANMNGHLLLTTGNKSESMVGYCTLYGDTCGGLNLIGELYKTDVFEMSRIVNEDAGREIIPLAIIEKAPSAELAPGQRDDDSLPPYPLLDSILRRSAWADMHGEAAESSDPYTVAVLKDALQVVREAAKEMGPVAHMQMLNKVEMLVKRSAFKRLQSAPSIALPRNSMSRYTK